MAEKNCKSLLNYSILIKRSSVDNDSKPFITITSPYIEHFLELHFTQGKQRDTSLFLLWLENIECGCSLEPPH